MKADLKGCPEQHTEPSTKRGNISSSRDLNTIYEQNMAEQCDTLTLGQCLERQFKKKKNHPQEFPGGPLVRTSCFHC